MFTAIKYGILVVKNKHLGNVCVRCQIVHNLHTFIRIGRVSQTQLVNISFYLQDVALKKNFKFLHTYFYLFTSIIYLFYVSFIMKTLSMITDSRKLWYDDIVNNDLERI